MQIIERIEFTQDELGGKSLQPLYMNLETGELKKNIEIWVDGSLRMKMNSHGCKGKDLETGIPVIGVFGDSGTFGVASMSTWLNHLSVPGFQILNGSGEGYSMERVLEMYKRLREEVKLDAVVVYTGWHNIVYNNTTEVYWRSILDQFDGDHPVSFCTLFSCLRPECRERGLIEFLCDPANKKILETWGDFSFWTQMSPSIKNTIQIMDGIERYHTFLKAYCTQRGANFIDLYSYMLPKSFDDIPKEFSDVCHPRPTKEIYGKIGAYVSQILSAQLVQKSSKTPLLKRIMTSRVIEKLFPLKTKKTAVTDETHNIYPLW